MIDYIVFYYSYYDNRVIYSTKANYGTKEIALKAIEEYLKDLNYKEIIELYDNEMFFISTDTSGFMKTCCLKQNSNKLKFVDKLFKRKDQNESKY